MADPKTVSPQLTRLARTMAWLSLAGAVFTALIAPAVFLFPDTMSAIGAFEFRHTGSDITGAIPLPDRATALCFAAIPTALAVWALIALNRLFRLYASGHVFSQDALNALWIVAATLFWRVVAEFVMQAPISFFLSHANPPGQRAMSLGLSSDDIGTLFMAGVVLVIARVMAEARRVADENASFV